MKRTIWIGILLLCIGIGKVRAQNDPPKSEYYDSSRQDRYQPMDVYPSVQTERFVFCFPAYKNR